MTRELWGIVRRRPTGEINWFTEDGKWSRDKHKMLVSGKRDVIEFIYKRRKLRGATVVDVNQPLP